MLFVSLVVKSKETNHEGHEEIRERNNRCHLSALMTADHAIWKLVEFHLRALHVLRG